MASPFKQLGKISPGKKKPPKKDPPKETKKSKETSRKSDAYWVKGQKTYVDKADSSHAAVADAKVEAKGTSAKPHGAAGVKGRTHFTAASKALALAKGELPEEYTIASVLREPNRG